MTFTSRNVCAPAGSLKVTKPKPLPSISTWSASSPLDKHSSGSQNYSPHLLGQLLLNREKPLLCGYLLPNLQNLEANTALDALRLWTQTCWHTLCLTLTTKWPASSTCTHWVLHLRNYLCSSNFNNRLPAFMKNMYASLYGMHCTLQARMKLEQKYTEIYGKFSPLCAVVDESLLGRLRVKTTQEKLPFHEIVLRAVAPPCHLLYPHSCHLRRHNLTPLDPYLYHPCRPLGNRMILPYQRRILPCLLQHLRNLW